MAALSSNFAQVPGLIGIAEGRTRAAPSALETCAAVRRSSLLTGSSGPSSARAATGASDVRTSSGTAGARRPLYPKRNILGFSFDFAED